MNSYYHNPMSDIERYSYAQISQQKSKKLKKKIKANKENGKLKLFI